MFHDNLDFTPPSLCSADFGNDFGGSVEASAGGSGVGGGNGNGAGGLGSGDGGAGGGISAVDLSGSTPGPDVAAGLFGAGTSIAALSLMAGANPFGAPLAALALTRGLLDLERQAAAGVAVSLSPDPDIATQQLSAFAGMQ